MAASDVFLTGMHHRHGKQATSLNQNQCWSKNCPNKTPRRSCIRSQIQFITHHLCSPSLLRSPVFLQLREAGGIEVLRDAHRSNSWVMLGELNAITEVIMQGEENTGSWNLGHAFFKRWKFQFKWIHLKDHFSSPFQHPSHWNRTDKFTIFTWRPQINGKLLLVSSEQVIPVHCLLSQGKEDCWSCLCQERWLQHWLSTAEP